MDPEGKKDGNKKCPVTKLTDFEEVMKRRRAKTDQNTSSDTQDAPNMNSVNNDTTVVETLDRKEETWKIMDVEEMTKRRKDTTDHRISSVEHSNTHSSNMELHTWLAEKFPSTPTQIEPPEELEANTWKNIRLFLSSTIIDTQAERDVIIKRVIPNVNRQLASRFIRIIPVDLRWGVLGEESKDCYAIQRTCLNQIDKCRLNLEESPWFLGIRTQRYGWIQDKLLSRESFEKPEKYEWIEKLGDYRKDMSITSMECVHASLPPTKKKEAPTVFFYKRNITNYKEIEDNMKWVFDFEYVSPDTKLEEEIKYQYSKKDHAEDLRRDQESLDRYLLSLNHVRYSTYQCHYEKGAARYTIKNEDSKSFGVGYVEGLEEFEKQVERDLMEAVEKNFKQASVQHFPDYEIESIQHENSVKSKASTFVGREDLLHAVYTHCVSNTSEVNVMTIHGEPGCGKSGILAAIAERCLNQLRKKGDFVFVHAVDSCPDSNYLMMMLRRLQQCLRHYRSELGETDLSECPTTTSDLKMEHLPFLVESASKYPNKRFILLIDAVNQFHESLQAWGMWWLPPKDAPKNLRVVFTTLNKENGTLFNSIQVCPEAIQLPVGEMSYEDRQEMVSSALARYNKKLTTTNVPYIGNQMGDLLKKSVSPLYLIAAAEALRRFGIYEKMQEYISKLPSEEISALFRFLLDGWVEEYGIEFTQFVTGLLCISKDGLLENEVNHIIYVKEKKEGMFNCSFSRMYDSLSNFLAAGGGGYLRFFHNQLMTSVREKFLTKEVEQKLHSCLVDFFSFSIENQLCEIPNEKPVAYYPHCLQQLVYHQQKLRETHKRAGAFLQSLRNIYFIRERIQNKQQSFLLNEYANAIKSVDDADENRTLKEWYEFARFYSPYVEMFPQWSYNMAINQPPSSSVAIDTIKLPKPDLSGQFPLCWTNNPSEVKGDKSIKYTGERCWRCVASSPEQNVCCVGADDKAFLFKQDSGEIIHQVKVEGVDSVYLTRDTFWTGDDKGFITVWNLTTGMKEWELQISTESCVIWIESIDGHVVCGTGDKWDADMIGTVAIVDEKNKAIVRKWSTKSPCLSYCYNGKENTIFSGHVGVIKGWSVGNGEKVKEFEVGGGMIRDMCAHPSESTIVYVSGATVKQLNVISEEYSAVINNTGKFITKYNKTGDRILCTSEDLKTLLVYDGEGNQVNKLKYHSSAICNISLVPQSDAIVTAANDGSMFFKLPSSPDHVLGEEEEDNVIMWCEFLVGGKEFATLSDKGRLKVWDTSTHKLRGFVDIECESVGKMAAIHPSGESIFVVTWEDLCLVDTNNLEIIKMYKVHEDEDVECRDVKISTSGSKCVVVTLKHGTIVFGVENSFELKKCLTYEKEDQMRSCDIHNNNMHIVNGGNEGIWMWDIHTGETLKTLSEKRSSFVKFMYDPDRVLCNINDYDADKRGEIRIMDLNGVDLHKFNCKVNNIQPIVLLRRDRHELITAEDDGSIRIHDIHSGEVVYTFVDHRSQGFECFLEQTSNNMLTAYNSNGRSYIFQNSRD